MMIKRGKQEKGAILIIAVIILMFLLLLAFPFLFRMSTEYRIAEKTYKSFAALNLAEAGIDRAIWELNYGDITTWAGDSSSRTMTLTDFQAFGGKVIGDVQITVNEPESDSPVVEATGTVVYSDTLEVSKTTRTVLKRSEFAPFTFAAFGSEGILTNIDTDTDSYDSRIGLYAVNGNQSSWGNIGTNSLTDGAITLNDDSEIAGNAYTGPESNPNLVIVLNDTSQIFKNKLPLFKSKKMTAVTEPKNLTPRGLYTLTGGAEDTINQSGEYSGFVLSDSAKVTVTGNLTLYVNGEFLMNSNSILDIFPGSTVKIYLGGENFEISGGAKLNNVSLNPRKLLILGTDSFTGTMHWESNSEFYGAIYVPKATVDYRTTYDLYGSLIAKKLISNAHYDIHFDIALFGFKLIGDPYAVKSWQEKLSQN
jgi:Tfp pilus assembly protein PilX